jgi:uncharacterized membrane protein
MLAIIVARVAPSQALFYITKDNFFQVNQVEHVVYSCRKLSFVLGLKQIIIIRIICFTNSYNYYLNLWIELCLLFKFVSKIYSRQLFLNTNIREKRQQRQQRTTYFK